MPKANVVEGVLAAASDRPGTARQIAQPWPTSLHGPFTTLPLPLGYVRSPASGTPLILTFTPWGYDRRKPWPTDWPAWLLLSTKPPPKVPLDLSPFGAAGYRLLIEPETFIEIPPGRNDWIRYQGGRVQVTWTPPAPGMRIWVQLVFRAPEGFRLSSAVEVYVGPAH